MKWQKKFTFDSSDEGWIKDLLGSRDETQFPLESDYVAHILKLYSGQADDPEAERLEEIEEQKFQRELAQICPETRTGKTGQGRTAYELIGSLYLDKIGSYFVCLKAKTARPHYFKLEGKPMSLKEVKKICARCRTPWKDYDLVSSKRL